MSENQNIEWKASWRDEYLKWVCGFANANGGIIEIGKNDDGRIIGISNARKLLEDLPNKIRDDLGLIANVNLHQEGGMDWLSIKVDPQPFPISYKGQFHYRSGSTKQELKGNALSSFLLQKHGKTWDSIPVSNVSIDELDEVAFEAFVNQAIKSNRLPLSVKSTSKNELVEQLRLNEGLLLKRAALLLFHADPEQFFTGAYVKVGYFRTESDLRFQDEVRGTLFDQVTKTVELLQTKYLEAQIRYDGLHRLEEFAYPEEALREAVLNAVAHKDYGTGIPIQIKVYVDRITIWNPGQLSPPITVDRLLAPHPSIPFNPYIATTLFRAGLIESWGHGTLKIIDSFKIKGLKLPVFTDEFSGLMVTFYNAPKETSGKTSGKILALIGEDEKITIPVLADKIGITERSIERNLKTLQAEGLLKRVGGAKGGYWELLSE